MGLKFFQQRPSILQENFSQTLIIVSTPDFIILKILRNDSTDKQTDMRRKSITHQTETTNRVPSRD